MNIVEFARTLNLSTGTVSRALNDRPEVSARTRARVLERAREVGFTCNPSARRLVMGRSYLIRLECPSNAHVLSDRYLLELARALEEAASARGYDLLLHMGAHRADAVEACAADGLVVIAAPETTAEDLVRITSGGRTPSVVIADAPVEGFQHTSYVCLNVLSGAGQALERLYALGHRRVGYIGSGHHNDRLRTALPDLYRTAGLEWNATLAAEAGTSVEEGLHATAHLLAEYRPTALFCRTDVLACGALRAAREAGLRVPEDLSIIGHDNTEIASLVHPALTTVAIDIGEVAASAMRTLVNSISLPDPEGSCREIHHTHLLVRASCGPMEG